MTTVYEQRKPWQLNAENLVSDALAASQTPGAVLQATVAPPLPQIDPFRPRFGYLSYDDRQARITDIIDIGRTYPDNRRWLSGGPAGYSASSRNAQTNGFN
jgi:hypothetical protein